MLFILYSVQTSVDSSYCSLVLQYVHIVLMCGPVSYGKSIGMSNMRISSFGYYN